MPLNMSLKIYSTESSSMPNAHIKVLLSIWKSSQNKVHNNLSKITKSKTSKINTKLNNKKNSLNLTTILTHHIMRSGMNGQSKILRKDSSILSSSQICMSFNWISLKMVLICLNLEGLWFTLPVQSIIDKIKILLSSSWSKIKGKQS